MTAASRLASGGEQGTDEDGGMAISEDLFLDDVYDDEDLDDLLDEDEDDEEEEET